MRPQETVVAGLAERSGVFQSEVKRLMEELGVTAVADKRGVEGDA